MPFIKTRSGWIAERLVARIEPAKDASALYLLDGAGEVIATSDRRDFDPDQGGYRPAQSQASADGD